MSERERKVGAIIITDGRSRFSILGRPVEIVYVKRDREREMG